MTALPLETIVLGDDASISADLARLWINCHEWLGWRLEIVRAEATTDYRVDSDRGQLRPGTPPNPRRPFTESQIADVVALTCEMDPLFALSRAVDLSVVGRESPASPSRCVFSAPPSG